MCRSKRYVGDKRTVVGERRAGVGPNSRHSSLISDYRDSKGKGKLKGKGKGKKSSSVCAMNSSHSLASARGGVEWPASQIGRLTRG